MSRFNKLRSIVLIGTLLTSSFGQERVYFGNLHSHTSYSDGIGTPREAYNHARDVAKLDFLGLTEHNHRGALGSDRRGIATNNALYNGGPTSLMRTALSVTRNGRFVALYGQEFSVIKVGNHMNVFEIPNVITATNGRFDELLEFLQANLDSAGLPAVVMLNHPKNSWTIHENEYGLDDFSDREDWLRRLGPHVALMQMVNGPGQKAGTGLKSARPAESAYKKFLTLGFKVAPTADQDNHTRNWGNATSARTAVVASELTRAGVLAALRSRHVYATEDKNLRIIIKINGHLFGSAAPVPSPSEAQIRYFILDDDEPTARYEIEVWRGTVDGDRPKLVTVVNVGSGSGTIEDVALTGSPEFFFFKIIQSDSGQDEDDDEDEAWTAPVWFETSTTPVSDGANNVISGLVASRHSKIYHVSDQCLDARRIRASNRITGGQARVGRVRHESCPRLDRN